MFKKHPQPKPSANIKSSERRKLILTIIDTYGLPELTKEETVSIAPAVIKLATYKSIQSHLGSIYYDDEETPVYFKTRDSQLYPTVYTCGKFPTLIPVVVTHPHVFEYIYSGADLMLPGCALPFDSRIKKGTIVGVIDSKTRVIRAVGVASLDLANQRQVVGTTGVAVSILHHEEDELAKLCPEPKDSLPVPESAPTPQDSQESTEAAPGPQDLQESTEPREQTEDVEEQINELATVVDELSTEDTDHFFERALLQTIKVEEVAFPVNLSKMMEYVLRNLPVLDPKYRNIKKTSWKKTGKFLKAMTKKGLIQTKGKDDDLSVVSFISKTDPRIANFETHRTVPKETHSNNDSNKDKLKVVQLFQPTNKYRMFFNKANEEYAAYYQLHELKNMLNLYIKKQDLVDKKDPKFILLDATLLDITSKGRVARAEVVNLFLKHMSPKYTVLKPGQDIQDAKIHNGHPPNIDILTKTKIGRKTVTEIRGFHVFGIRSTVLAEDLRNLCQGSSTIEQDHTGDVVMVQGPHYKIIHNYLTNEKGIPASMIKFEDKSKKRKR